MKLRKLLESVTVTMKNDKWRDSYKHASNALKDKGMSVIIKDAGKTLVVGGDSSTIEKILNANEDVGTFSIN